MVRHVDALDPLPDERIKEQDAAYLAEHKIDNLFQQILDRMLRTKPKDHMQFIIDCLTFDSIEDADQDPATGISKHRLKKLDEVFVYIDKDADGKIKYQDIQLFTSRYGGTVMSEDELKDVFRDFDRSDDKSVSKDEFFMFFSKLSSLQKNQDFDEMIKDMTS
mmetsp:Transcript_22722/g.57013  ORF Transcript_22722/g.57013 Transcript_22722/m.57013 type:complete len:163 (+) Transcript_22722:101-589(+)